MTTELFAVLAMLGVVVVMFTLNKPRMDAVALLVLCSLPLTGLMSMTEALAGFSEPNVILIAAFFVLGDGLVRTGVAHQLGDWVIRRAGSHSGRLTALIMFVVCGLGSVMSSTAVTAIFIPVVLRICQRTRIAPSQLMLPLSYAALISGMMTLVATAPNLVVNSELVRRGYPGFHLFSLTPFGVPILVLGIGYLLLVRRWLPNHQSQDPTSQARPTLSEWIDKYALADRVHRFRIASSSSLAGQDLESLRWRVTQGVNLVAIQRGHKLIQPAAKTRLEAHDILLVDFFAQGVDLPAFTKHFSLDELPVSGTHFLDQTQEIGMAEMFISADSGLIGKTILESGIRSRFGFSVIGMRRGLNAVKLDLNQEQLKLGDILLVIGPWKAIRRVHLVGSGDLLPLNFPAELDDVLPASRKSWQALGTLLLVVVVMIFGWLPHVQVALLGCLLMGSMRCITFESAYRAIDWKTIVLIAGMIPFSLALQRTGGVDLASQALATLAPGLGSYGILAILFVVTTLCGLFISNTATAVLMAPVAFQVAEQLGYSPYPFAMIVALASSTAFITPVSSPVNALVVTPGNYRFGDFVRIGLPFAVVVLVVSVLLVPWLLPL